MASAARSPFAKSDSHTHPGMVIERRFEPLAPDELAARLRQVFAGWLLPPAPEASTMQASPKDDHEASRRDHPRLDRQAA